MDRFPCEAKPHQAFCQPWAKAENAGCLNAEDAALWAEVSENCKRGDVCLCSRSARLARNEEALVANHHACLRIQHEVDELGREAGSLKMAEN